MDRVVRIRNGEKAVSTFSEREFKSRRTKLREVMQQADVDAVIFTSIQNINYYGDFLYCSFGRPYALLVTHDRVLSISANIDGGQPWRRTVDGDNLVFTDWKKNNYYFGIQQECANMKGKIGVEHDHLTVERLNLLQNALLNNQLVDISWSVMQLRMFKSAEEIEHIAAAAYIADCGGEACAEAIGEGVPEHEVALHSTQRMIREIAQRFPDGELMDTWTWFQSGINTDGAHNPVTTRKIQKGDILSLNCFPMIAGYYVALERTLFYDHCDDASMKLWQVNCKVHDEGKKLITPGARCGDIALALNEIYKEHDLLQYRTFGYGHSFGVLSHYYGREAGLELREDVDTVLEPGMVVSMEPMIMLPEGIPGAGGYREHDILVVTEKGNRNLTGFPYGHEHNIIS